MDVLHFAGGSDIFLQVFNSGIDSTERDFVMHFAIWLMGLAYSLNPNLSLVNLYISMKPTRHIGDTEFQLLRSLREPSIERV